MRSDKRFHIEIGLEYNTLWTRRHGVKIALTYGKIDENCHNLRCAKRCLRNLIRRHRRNMTWIEGDSKVAGVRLEPNWFAEEAHRRKMRVIMEEKYPKTKHRYVGIEIEFLSPLSQNEIRRRLIQADLSKYVNLTTDGSVCDEDRDCDGSCREDCDCCPSCDCDNGTCDSCTGNFDCYCECTCSSTGHELRVLVPQMEAGPVIDRICRVLNNECKAYVNDTCGLHVHLDMRHRDYRKAFNNLTLAQPVLYSMNPVQRLKNTYCVPTKHSEFESARYNGRYVGVNASAYREHKTLEVRLHSGTTNAVKIKYWVELLVRIATARAFKTPIETLKTLKARVSLGAMLCSYIRSRIARFKNEHAGQKVNVYHREAA